jgi:CO dehydrogenase nickel-insertion accessory protein CooC1
MVLVSDASNAGLQTLLRLHELAAEMKMAYGKLALVINKLRGPELPGRAAEIQEKTGADLAIGLPDDDEVAAFAENSRSFLEISDSNPVYEKVGDLYRAVSG